MCILNTTSLTMLYHLLSVLSVFAAGPLYALTMTPHRIGAVCAYS